MPVIQLLADLLAELDEDKQQQIGHAQPLTTQPSRPVIELRLQPGKALPGGLLEFPSHRRIATNAVLEQLEPLGTTEARGHRLHHRLVDAPPPHAGMRPLLGAGADQWRGREEFLQVLADGRGLGDGPAIPELEDRRGAGRVELEEGRLTVLPGQDVDMLHWQLHPLRGGEQANQSRIGANRTVQFHVVDSPGLRTARAWCSHHR
ncbi:hypothetical protein D3C81_1520860 [compost metagenome]